MLLNGEAESRVSPNVVSILTTPPFDQCYNTGRPVASSQQKNGVSKASEDAGFTRKVSLGQCFVTID